MQVASHFAHRPAEVHCPSTAEWVDDPIWGGDPYPQRAWGYTDMVRDFIVMQPLLCAGAIAITDTKLPAWQRATGALVLVHEAYHVRLWKSRWSEARVECQAIRHFVQGAELLGASVEIANDLLPYALAAHQRMVRLYPSYPTAVQAASVGSSRDAVGPRGRHRFAPGVLRQRLTLVEHPRGEGSWSGGRRLVYRACYVVLLVSGRAAASLATEFRALASAGAPFGPLRVLLQLAVLACWLFVRPISLAAFAACCALASPRSPPASAWTRR